MSDVYAVKGREILDSRGLPTVEAEVQLNSGTIGRASVPSGASTGSHEVLELRDGDKTRYMGKGVLQAIEHIQNEIADIVMGMNAQHQAEIDDMMINLDATENKSKLGANAILAVSLAVARAQAKELRLPFYKYLGGINGHILPVPMMNILNGGKHTDNKLDIQEFMIMPVGAESFRQALRMGAEVFQTLKQELKKAGHNTNVGDEGGFAPQLKTPEEALDFIVAAIQKAGYEPRKDVAIALDVAASELYEDGMYYFAGLERKFKSDKEFLIFKGRRISLKLRESLEGETEKIFKGEIIDWDDAQGLKFFRFDDAKELFIPKENIQSAKLYVD